jgi:hypothetical protein
VRRGRRQRSRGTTRPRWRRPFLPRGSDRSGGPARGESGEVGRESPPPSCVNPPRSESTLGSTTARSNRGSAARTPKLGCNSLRRERRPEDAPPPCPSCLSSPPPLSLLSVHAGADASPSTALSFSVTASHPLLPRRQAGGWCGMARQAVGDGALVRDPARDAGSWRFRGGRQVGGIRLPNGT